MKFNNLTSTQKREINKTYVEMCVLVTKDMGHFYDCAYTQTNPNCNCADRGVKIHQALVDLVAKLDE